MFVAMTLSIFICITLDLFEEGGMQSQKLIINGTLANITNFPYAAQVTFISKPYDVDYINYYSAPIIGKSWI